MLLAYLGFVKCVQFLHDQVEMSTGSGPEGNTTALLLDPGL